MARSLTLAAALIIVNSACAANAGAGYQIDSTSVHRTVCNVKFEKIAGLVIKVWKISPSSLRSRIDNEEYAACRYRVAIKYAGRELRLYFANSFNGAPRNIDSVDDASPGDPVFAGDFIYDGKRWQSNLDGMLDDDITSIHVRRGTRSLDVRGAVHGRHLENGLEYFCYGVSILNHAGIAMTGICSSQRKDIMPWQQFFESKTVIQSVE